MTDFLNIPGNVKQSMLPFNLEPNRNSVNQELLSGETNSFMTTLDSDKFLKGPGHAQMFSFKYSSMLKYADKQGTYIGEDGSTINGQLNICPSSYKDFISLSSDSDISLYSLFDNITPFENNDKKTLEFERSLLDKIPTIRIREYQQDAKLNQVLNLFGAFTEGWKLGSEAGSSTGNGWSLSETGKMIWTVLKKIITTLPTILVKGYKDVRSLYDDNVNDNYSPGSTGDHQLDSFILKIPYLLYYRMMSTFTTNIYEVPFTGKSIITSDGTTGWSDYGLKNMNTTGSGIFSELLNFFGKNIRISTTPIWDGTSETTGSTYTIQFTLFNDTAGAATQNFIFINTIFPNNRWLQYHIYQHSPSLYDIKIDGIGRAMLCAGQFECEAIGPLRTPSDEILRRLMGHMNTGHDKLNILELRRQKVIVIPDAYDVKLTFKSLLPDNFNNYLYQFVMKDNFDKYYEANTLKDLHDDSAFEKFSKSIVDQIKDIYNNTAAELFSKSYNPKDYGDLSFDQLKEYADTLDMSYQQYATKYKDLYDKVMAKYGIEGMSTINNHYLGDPDTITKLFNSDSYIDEFMSYRYIPELKPEIPKN